MTRSTQYHSDGPSQGFIPVNTDDTLIQKWRVDNIGHVGYASPVIGADGTVYIGTFEGDLVAVTSTGTIKWRLPLTKPGKPNYPGKITASPAVGGDGNIYVITTVRKTVRDHRGIEDKTKRILRSTLHSVNPNGTLRWSFLFPENASPSGLGGYTTSAPKVWGSQELHIFVPAIYQTTGFAFELLVINQFGNLAFRTDIASYPPAPLVGEGPGFWEILEGVWDFISSPVDFDTGGVGTSLEQEFGWPEPSIAIVDYPSFGNKPLIIVEDNYKTTAAFQFESRIPVPLWKNTSNEGRLRSSPAVFTNGVLAIGQKDGTLCCYDVNTGNEIGKPWYKASKPIIAPPASFGRQIYFIADKELIALDSYSELWKKQTLGGKSLAAPTLSGNFVHISARDGLYTYTFDLEDHKKISGFNGGVSSPVIASDGTVYAMDLHKRLWAFGGTIAAKATAKIGLMHKVKKFMGIKSTA